MAVSPIKNRDVIRKAYTVTLSNNGNVSPWTKFGQVTIDSIDGYVPVSCFAKAGNSIQRMMASLYGTTLCVYGMSDASTSQVEVLYFKN